MRWSPLGAAALVLVLAGGPVAAAQSPGSSSTSTTTDASAAATTTTTPPDSSTTTEPSTTVDPQQAGRTTSTTKPAKPKPPKTTTTAATTTTTVPVRASGTWITAPGYNPEWHSINPPWVPKPPPGSGFGRRIVYSKFQQRVWLMEDNGYITNTHLVSGRYDIPAFGVYHVYSKSLSTFATHNPSITWHYMVRFAVGPQGGGIGLHEIPLQYGRPVQTYAQLGQPLSGGCLRQTHEDAVLVWNWAPIGTPVIVVP